MKLLRTFTPVLFVTLALGLVFLLTDTAFAQSAIQDGVNAAKGDGQPADLFGGAGILTTVTNILLFVVGALSVVMLIFGGLRYVLSAGNSSAVTAAKNTILYAIVGLIIAFVAYAAVNFVLSALAPGSSAGFTNV